ncbi:uncharacterized protein [Blastocystis hominis]|uniref:RNA polymerase II subunit A C-terminal domain phosphatase SSU72 n=1 Tax=Blastocystis hominis TaxID=12968 RepID=D8M8U6_BLAHO|nr:uncharacterized protein [Blastocystis hominis]CBK24485.2 unnamed protein product [Blastocystis hominis]|eukprot:XP_012898533.1 uncharacterized protein [Blastocystis hominis]
MQEKGYQFATICSSNVNRSMEAHSLFKKNHLRVCSYGTGRKIKIPGLSEKKPLEYGFGTEYETILNDLIELNKDFFTEREIIPMIQRDKGVKKAPQRFQDEFDLSFIDVCICFDEHVFDSVVEELQFRGCSKIKPIFVFNIHVKDRVSTAREGAKHALRLAEMVWMEWVAE